MRKPLRKKTLSVLAIGLVGLIAIQFIRPSLDNRKITGEPDLPPDVKKVLKRACYDCHSNEPKLAWFDQPAPAYWLVVHDIREARKVLNFSEWDSLSKEQQKARLFESFDKIVFKEMPLKPYRMLHGVGTITTEEEGILKNYLGTLVKPVSIPDSAKRDAANLQYEQWIQGSTIGKQVDPAPNGIEFMPDYKNWTAISTTERFDNGTLRVILGNDQAVKAIKEQHVNPWPDGTVFAKVAWDQAPDSTGYIYTGAFRQVEFMIRDNKKYASSDGWGWARWVKGTQLAVYGRNPLFVTECMNCHKPMENRDFIFSYPLNFAPKAGNSLALQTVYNEQASLPSDATINPLEWKVVSSGVDRSGQTQSTLYGNDLAVKTARTAPGQGYPAGTVLSLVTWSQKEDKNWYGGHIPASIQTIEKLSFVAGAAGNRVSAVYECYKGVPLKKMTETDSLFIKKRVAFLSGQRASVMP